MRRNATAIYCRVPHRRANDQNPVSAQELLCRETAAALDAHVDERAIFIDPRATAWLPDRDGPQWRHFLLRMRGGRFTHAVVYGLEDLRRFAPYDLAELLDAADEHAAELHDPCNGLDWNDPERRQTVRAELSRVLQAAKHMSDTARAGHEQAAADGRIHGGGRRAYGYEAGTYRLVDAEAAVVREVYTRFVAGESLGAIAADLNGREFPTALGAAWTPNDLVHDRRRNVVGLHGCVTSAGPVAGS